MPTLKTQIRWFTRIQQAIVGAVLLVAIGFYALAYRPETSRLQTLSDRIGRNERDLMSAESQARVLPQVQADINRLNAVLADFKRLPSNPDDLGQFEVEMGTLAWRYNLQGWKMLPGGTPVRDQDFYELPITLKFAGDFQSVYSFLCEIEDLSRMTRVRKMTVTSDGNDGSVQVEMLLNLYYSQG